MRVAIVGGTGFVGSYIVESLLDAGHEVSVLVRPGSESKLLRAGDVRVVSGDIDAPEALDELGVDPKLVDQVGSTDGQQDLERKTHHKQGHVENPLKQETRARLPQSGRKIVILALVMHRMRGPQYRYLVAATVAPVVAKIPAYCGSNPEGYSARRRVEPGNRHIEGRKIFEHQPPYQEFQQCREIARG